MVEDTLCVRSDPQSLQHHHSSATSCSFYDKIPFVELPGRGAGPYLAKKALQGKPVASPAIPVPPYSVREVLSACEAL